MIGKIKQRMEQDDNWFLNAPVHLGSRNYDVSQESYFGETNPLTDTIVSNIFRIYQYLAANSTNKDKMEIPKAKEIAAGLTTLCNEFGDQLAVILNAYKVGVAIIDDPNPNAFAYPVGFDVKLGRIDEHDQRIAALEDIVENKNGYRFKNKKDITLIVGIHLGLFEGIGFDAIGNPLGTLFGPAKALAFTPREIAGIVAHEIGHCMQQMVVGINEGMALRLQQQAIKSQVWVYNFFVRVAALIFNPLYGIYDFVVFMVFLITEVYMNNPTNPVGYILDEIRFALTGESLASTIRNGDDTEKTKVYKEQLALDRNATMEQMKKASERQMADNYTKDGPAMIFFMFIMRVILTPVVAVLRFFVFPGMRVFGAWSAYFRLIKNNIAFRALMTDGTIQTVVAGGQRYWTLAMNVVPFFYTTIVRRKTLVKAKYAEEFADAFAIFYGLGPDLAAAMAKILKANAGSKLGIFTPLNYIPLLNVAMAAFDMLDMAQSQLLAGYPLPAERLANMYKVLQYEVNNNSDLSPEQLRNIQTQMEDIKKTYDDFIYGKNGGGLIGYQLFSRLARAGDIEKNDSSIEKNVLSVLAEQKAELAAKLKGSKLEESVKTEETDATIQNVVETVKASLKR